jgi:hypothetical protein
MSLYLYFAYPQRRIILLPVACPPYPYFSTLSQKDS